MDAARLVAEAERVMRRHPRPEDVIAEAWQAYELTEAVARLLDDGDGRQERGSGAPARGGPEHGGPVARAGPAPVAVARGPGPRAALLTSVRDPAGTLRALRVLLGEIGLALVAVTGTVEAEADYWDCVEALDAVDEAKDRVRELVRDVQD